MISERNVITFKPSKHVLGYINNKVVIIMIDRINEYITIIT